MELNLVISKTPVIYLLQARARVNNQAVAETKELMNGELNRLQKSLEKAQSNQVSKITIIILYLLPFVLGLKQIFG